MLKKFREFKEFKEFRSFLKRRPEFKPRILIFLMIAGGDIILGIRDQLKQSTIVLLVVVTVVSGIFYLLFCYLMERQDRKLIEQHNKKVREFLETEEKD